MPVQQQNRILAISTALGDDALVLKAISVEEPLGRLFRIEAELASEDAEIDFDKIVGTNATIRLELGDGGTRFFNGVVSRFVQMGNKGGFARYHASLVPWFWLLTRTAECRIFQEMTIPEIIEKVFRDHGLNDYQLNLSESHSKREYCVQYRETDFNFVSRLMEQEGIYYCFKHENGKHTMVLADSASAHSAAPGFEEVEFVELEEGAEGHLGITSWQIEREVQPGTYALNDFDFKLPKKSLLSLSTKSRQHGAADFEMYDYPGEYVEASDGERLSKVRLEEYQSQHEVCSGQATTRGLSTGSIFKLKRHPRADQNREYLITGVSLQAEAGEFAAGGGEGGGDFFSCAVRAMNSEEAFRSRQSTPKPLIQGPQTAIVVAPDGEEIHVDEFGRVKVRFHWDRLGKGDETSSCWIRVAQVWAGKQWGGIFTPRKDQEVIVEFLEGDPDRPIITGRVYNGEAKPPYELPANKTMSTLKSSSSKGGAGFNEIRLEDKKGDEQIFIHAEKNHDVRVKNDSFEWVGNNRHLVVKKDQFAHVENNQSVIVDQDHKEKIGKDRHLRVVGKEAKGVDGSLSLTVKGDVAEVFEANHSETTKADYYLKADNIVIEGQTNVTVKVGGSSIAIGADGIALKTDGTIKIEAGATMDLKATAPLSMESSATAELKSPATTVKGDGMLTLKGGAVMIN
ncbi:MAG TPA: type VI secretion system tip protein VgrG [Verrucomicrobiales bacterium]|nr:type VI secretion system tip protein VgrG [Verrucomicrobiales bacterium]